jgi:hypothetical protein
MDLRAKLQLKSDQEIELVDAPVSQVVLFSEMELDSGSDIGTALLVFVINREALEKRVTMIVKAAALDHLTWVAYPKSGQLGTDLNRDILATFLTERGVQPVRQVAIDEVWSALRFRPA